MINNKYLIIIINLWNHAITLRAGEVEHGRGKGQEVDYA